MELVRLASAAALLDVAGDFLVAHEAEHNLPLGILGTLREHPEAYPDPPYLATIIEPAVALVALRTPPFNLVLSEAGVAADLVVEAIRLLVNDLRTADPDVPGVLGPTDVAEAFAAAWADATGCGVRLVLAERIYRLRRVRPPLPVPGTWRLAENQDRDLLREWVVTFRREALPDGHPQPDVDALVGRWLRGAGSIAYLWDDGGKPVSLVVAGSPTPHGVRIGPVYTPPDARRRGYATALTAAASRHQLDLGRTFCFLFTDLANPTANHIYQSIGYEPVSDVHELRFDRANSVGAGSR